MRKFKNKTEAFERRTFRERIDGTARESNDTARAHCQLIAQKYSKQLNLRDSVITYGTSGRSNAVKMSSQRAIFIADFLDTALCNILVVFMIQ